MELTLALFRYVMINRHRVYTDEQMGLLRNEATVTHDRLAARDASQCPPL